MPAEAGLQIVDQRRTTRVTPRTLTQSPCRHDESTPCERPGHNSEISYQESAISVTGRPRPTPALFSHVPSGIRANRRTPRHVPIESAGRCLARCRCGHTWVDQPVPNSVAETGSTRHDTARCTSPRGTSPAMSDPLQNERGNARRPARRANHSRSAQVHTRIDAKMRRNEAASLSPRRSASRVTEPPDSTSYSNARTAARSCMMCTALMGVPAASVPSAYCGGGCLTRP